MVTTSAPHQRPQYSLQRIIISVLLLLCCGLSLMLASISMCSTRTKTAIVQLAQVQPLLEELSKGEDVGKRGELWLAAQVNAGT